MKLQIEDQILYAISTYHYRHAEKLVQSWNSPQADLLEILHIMAERRDLNILPAMNKDLQKSWLAQYNFQLFEHENPEEEQLANYLYDLEAKLKNEQIIDFIRAVSPAFYRIFMRLIKGQIPDIESYIHNSKEARYDRWKFEKMRNSDNPILQYFHTESAVSSSSLVALINLLDLSDETKARVQDLRQLEKSVRNPLAHLIKLFDEEELHRTTGFSSRFFMDNLISLARETGIVYDQKQFYFDRANKVIQKLLKAD